MTKPFSIRRSKCPFCCQPPRIYRPEDDVYRAATMMDPEYRDRFRLAVLGNLTPKDSNGEQMAFQVRKEGKFGEGTDLFLVLRKGYVISMELLQMAKWNGRLKDPRWQSIGNFFHQRTWSTYRACVFRPEEMLAGYLSLPIQEPLDVIEF